jgi:hypothetical protein
MKTSHLTSAYRKCVCISQELRKQAHDQPEISSMRSAVMDNIILRIAAKIARKGMIQADKSANFPLYWQF